MLLIRGGNVYLGQGRYEAGWDVLCNGSIIRAVGPNLSCEAGEVIEAVGKNVYPGAVLGLCAVGAMAFNEIGAVDADEASGPLVPQMDIRDAFDLQELKRQRFGRAGITSYGLSPGTMALLAGQVSLLHTDGDHTADVFLANRVALKGNYTSVTKASFRDKGGRRPAWPCIRCWMRHSGQPENMERRRRSPTTQERRSSAGFCGGRSPW